MPIEPPKPKCKVCQRIKQQANRWFRIERIQEQGHLVGTRWSALKPEVLCSMKTRTSCADLDAWLKKHRILHKD